MRRVPERRENLLPGQLVGVLGGHETLGADDLGHDGGDINRVPAMQGFPNRTSGSSQTPGKISTRSSRLLNAYPLLPEYGVQVRTRRDNPPRRYGLER